MKVCFYCSYNLSPVGYQEITFDTETGIQSQTPIDAEVAKTLLTHGGAKTAIGYEGSMYYLVLKGMRKTKPEIPVNTPGRDWYANCALTAPVGELTTLCAVAYYGYTAYQEFVTRLTACLTPQEDETSYVVDANGWRELMTEASARYQAFLETGDPDFKGAPCGLGREQMEEALEILRSSRISGLYEFVLLEGELGYFLSSCGCEDPTQVRYYVKAGGDSSEEVRHTANPDVSKTQADFLSGLLIGGAAALTLYTAYRAGKAVGRIRRKRQRRR